MDPALGSNSSLLNQHNDLRKVTMLESTHCPPPPPPSPATSVKTRRKSRKVLKKGEDQDAGQTPKSSLFRGVTKHRHTGRYEVHLWDKFSWNMSQNKRGKQVYVGSFDNEEEAAYTYDLAALKYFGPHCVINFPLHTYMKEYAEMKNVSKSEYVARLRRKSSGFARGDCKYRGVTKHHKKGRWEARIGNVHGKKYLYLGSFNSEDEAATAYDLAALHYRGPNVVTNFDISKYRTPHLQFQQMRLPPPQQLYGPSIIGSILPTSENLIQSESLINSGISDTMPMNTMMGSERDGNLNYAMDQNGISDNMLMGTDVANANNGLVLQNGGMNLDEMGDHLTVPLNQGSSSNIFEQFRDGEYFNMDGLFDAALSEQFGDDAFSNNSFFGIDETGAGFHGTANGGDQAPGAADFVGFSENEGFLPCPSF